MSYLSDPDRLERLAFYISTGETPVDHELITALNDAAERIRGLQQAQEAQHWRAAALGVTVDDLLRWGENVAKAEPRLSAAGPAVWCEWQQRSEVSATGLLAALRTEADR